MSDLPRIKLKELMDSLPDGLSPIERVILAHDGTVHTLLSLLTGKPIYINVESQTEDEGMITREVTFTIDGKVIMRADSIMLVRDNPPEFIKAIRREHSGIGQIINYMDLKTTRNIEAFNSQPCTSCFMPDTIYRRYSITGDCTLRISEHFYRTNLKEVLDL